MRFYTSLWGVHIIVVYILDFFFILEENSKTPTSKHTIDTPESLKPHKLWNGSWFHANLISLTVCQYSFINTLIGHWITYSSIPIFLWMEQNCLSQQNLVMGYPRPLQISSTEILKIFKGLKVLHLTCYNLVTTTVYCKRKKQTMSSNQAVKVVVWSAVVLELLLLLLLLRKFCKWIKEENVDLTINSNNNNNNKKHPLL